jgi:hypothetical protein
MTTRTAAVHLRRKEQSPITTSVRPISTTVAEDGESLDVLLFLDAPLAVGYVLTARLIGAKQGERLRNDRLPAVATHAHTHQHIQTVHNLRPHLVDEIEDFFRHYHEMKGVEFNPVDQGAPKKRGNLSTRPKPRSELASPGETTINSGMRSPCQLSKPG